MMCNLCFIVLFNIVRSLSDVLFYFIFQYLFDIVRSL